MLFESSFDSSRTSGKCTFEAIESCGSTFEELHAVIAGVGVRAIGAGERAIELGRHHCGKTVESRIDPIEQTPWPQRNM